MTRVHVCEQLAQVCYALTQSNRDDTTGGKWDLMRECRRIPNRGRLTDYRPTSPITCNAEAELRKFFDRARSILWSVDTVRLHLNISQKLYCAQSSLTFIPQLVPLSFLVNLERQQQLLTCNAFVRMLCCPPERSLQSTPCGRRVVQIIKT